MSDKGQARAFEQVVEIAQEQARATASLVELERQNGQKLDSLMAIGSATTVALSAVSVSLASMDSARDNAVESVKNHVSIKMAEGERSWKFMVWVIAALVAASNLLAPLLLAMVTKKP